MWLAARRLLGGVRAPAGGRARRADTFKKVFVPAEPPAREAAAVSAATADGATPECAMSVATARATLVLTDGHRRRWAREGNRRARWRGPAPSVSSAKRCRKGVALMVLHSKKKGRVNGFLVVDAVLLIFLVAPSRVAVPNTSSVTSRRAQEDEVLAPVSADELRLPGLCPLPPRQPCRVPLISSPPVEPPTGPTSAASSVARAGKSTGGSSPPDAQAPDASETDRAPPQS